MKLSTCVRIALLLLAWTIYQKNKSLGIIIVIFVIIYKYLVRAKSVGRILAKGVDKANGSLDRMGVAMARIGDSLNDLKRSLPMNHREEDPEELFSPSEHSAESDFLHD